MSQQLRIIVKRRKTIDLEKLARALLEHVESLSNEEVARLAAMDEPAAPTKKQEGA